MGRVIIILVIVAVAGLMCLSWQQPQPSTQLEDVLAEGLARGCDQ